MCKDCGRAVSMLLKKCLLSMSFPLVQFWLKYSQWIDERCTHFCTQFLRVFLHIKNRVLHLLNSSFEHNPHSLLKLLLINK